MKYIITALIYIGCFMSLYLILSGCIWIVTSLSYKEIIHSINWFMSYTILIGWWAALFPSTEYYESKYL